MKVKNKEEQRHKITKLITRTIIGKRSNKLKEQFKSICVVPNNNDIHENSWDKQTNKKQKLVTTTKTGHLRKNKDRKKKNNRNWTKDKDLTEINSIINNSERRHTTNKQIIKEREQKGGGRDSNTRERRAVLPLGDPDKKKSFLFKVLLPFPRMY